MAGFFNLVLIRAEVFHRGGLEEVQWAVGRGVPGEEEVAACASSDEVVE